MSCGENKVDTFQYYYLHSKWYSKGHKWWLLGHALQHKWSFAIISFFSIIGIVLQTFIPFILGNVFDTIIPTLDLELAIRAGMIILVLGLAKLFTNFISSALNEIMGQKVEMQIRLEFYESLQSKSMDFHDSSKIGDLMSMATADTRMINAAVSPGVRMVASTLITLIATFIAMWIASPILSLIFLLILPIYLLLLSSFAKRLNPLSVQRQAQVARMSAELQENLTGVRVVRTFSGQKREIDRFSDTVMELENILVKRGITSAFYLPSLLIGLTNAVIFLSAVYFIQITLGGELVIPFLGVDLTIAQIGIGELITFLVLTSFLIMPTMFLRWIIDMTLLGFAGSQRIFSVVSTESEQLQGSYLTDSIKGKIEFDNVSFSYKENSPLVLNDISLKINPGETVVILGPTGCGKTTIIKLLLSLYCIKQGAIKVDGVDLKEWDINNLRENIGLIEQDTFLFSTTIKSNISYGKPDATDEEIIDAAKSAQAHDFIMSFKDGYDTIVGERGVTLSGGQKQRIAMARGFVLNPKILIMDSSTSAVDAETEAKIQQAIEKLLEGRTTIVITHRLSTLRQASKIVFMEKGRIIKIGTHDEMIKSFEPYRDIFKRYLTLPPLEKETNARRDQ